MSRHLDMLNYIADNRDLWKYISCALYICICRYVTRLEIYCFGFNCPFRCHIIFLNELLQLIKTFRLFILKPTKVVCYAYIQMYVCGSESMPFETQFIAWSKKIKNLIGQSFNKHNIEIQIWFLITVLLWRHLASSKFTVISEKWHISIYSIVILWYMQVCFKPIFFNTSLIV